MLFFEMFRLLLIVIIHFKNALFFLSLGSYFVLVMNPDGESLLPRSTSSRPLHSDRKGIIEVLWLPQFMVILIYSGWALGFLDTWYLSQFVPSTSSTEKWLIVSKYWSKEA